MVQLYKVKGPTPSAFLVSPSCLKPRVLSMSSSKSQDNFEKQALSIFFSKEKDGPPLYTETQVTHPRLPSCQPNHVTHLASEPALECHATLPFLLGSSQQLDTSFWTLLPSLLYSSSCFFLPHLIVFSSPQPLSVVFLRHSLM